jgi:uncharacterized protein YndB with AHSA1/START domain
MTRLPESPVLEIVRIFDAPPAAVFEAWLDREQWQSWIGPEGVDCEVPLLERRVGGRYRLIMHLPDGNIIGVTGIFKAIDANKGFAMTWGAEGGTHETLVTVSLRDLHGRTELTLRHEGLPGADDRNSHDKGWRSALNKLANHLGSNDKARALQ